MIRVTIEIVPHGIEDKAFVHSIATIANDGIKSLQTHGELGDYNAKFMQSYDKNPKQLWKKGHATDIHRTKRGIWDILFCCLYNAGMFKRNRKNL